jgi:hypothetical protein
MSIAKIPAWPTVLVVVALAVLGDAAISAQDKHTVQVPDGLEFSEFRGYEDWKLVAVSQSGNLVEVILGNPEIIAAYQAGVPGNGKPFPDGSIHGQVSLANTPARQLQYLGIKILACL